MRESRWSAFKAKPVTVDGERLDSKREAKRWGELQQLERAGAIRGLVRQPKFDITINGEPVRALPTKRGLGRKLSYRADFAYFEGEKRIVEDVKALDDPTSRLRRAIVQHIHHIEIRVVK